MYAVRITRKAIKAMSRIPRRDRLRLGATIDALTSAPKPANSKPLRGTRNGHRLRVGRYRVVYTIEKRKLVVRVIRVGLRKDIYRGS